MRSQRKQNSDETIIGASPKIWDWHLGELWKYRDLIALFIKRNFIVQYKQTILGPIWLIIAPLITSIIYTFVFGGFVGVDTGAIPQFLFFLASNNMWILLNTGVCNTANTFVAQSYVFGKVYFPRLSVPISQVVTCVLNFIIQFAIFLIFYIIACFNNGGIYLSVHLLLVPILVLECALLALGVGLIITSLTTRYRDLAMTIGFGMQLWMYISAVIYPVSTVTGVLRTFLLLNPVAPIVENFRYALFNSGEFLGLSWGVSWITTALCLIGGVVLFNKIETTFMDTI